MRGYETYRDIPHNEAHLRLKTQNPGFDSFSDLRRRAAQKKALTLTG